jgi:hypothetical protein
MWEADSKIGYLILLHLGIGFVLWLSLRKLKKLLLSHLYEPMYDWRDTLFSALIAVVIIGNFVALCYGIVQIKTKRAEICVLAGSTVTLTVNSFFHGGNHFSFRKYKDNSNPELGTEAFGADWFNNSVNVIYNVPEGQDSWVKKIPLNCGIYDLEIHLHRPLELQNLFTGSVMASPLEAPVKFQSTATEKPKNALWQFLPQYPNF